MMAEITYILCSITALLCSVLLFRGFRVSRARLLFWSGVCFLLLFVENTMLFIDVVIVPHVGLTVFRLAPGVAAVCCLIYGLIWEAE
jgi:hypothetical protein